MFIRLVNRYNRPAPEGESRVQGNIQSMSTPRWQIHMPGLYMTRVIHGNITKGVYLVKSSVVIVAKVTPRTLPLLDVLTVFGTNLADDFVIVTGEMYRHRWWWRQRQPGGAGGESCSDDDGGVGRGGDSDCNSGEDRCDRKGAVRAAQAMHVERCREEGRGFDCSHPHTRLLSEGPATGIAFWSA